MGYLQIKCWPTFQWDMYRDNSLGLCLLAMPSVRPQVTRAIPNRQGAEKQMILFKANHFKLFLNSWNTCVGIFSCYHTLTRPSPHSPMNIWNNSALSVCEFWWAANEKICGPLGQKGWHGILPSDGLLDNGWAQVNAVQSVCVECTEKGRWSLGEFSWAVPELLGHAYTIHRGLEPTRHQSYWLILESPLWGHK